MSKNESILIDLASNGRADSYPRLQTSSSHQLQMVQLQTPHLKDTSASLDMDTSAGSAERDLFSNMEPHLRFNSKTSSTRSKL
ncbi:hypothetical protein EDD11_004753 [Mortierella claussenii]|nr:hypothetical protein EDD11_004753 [Mortierella claussenii]